jgi:Dolichyl-phosphate-mannose-protein mannosyltransferase
VDRGAFRGNYRRGDALVVTNSTPLLIYRLLRSYTGKGGAIFGAMCWMSMPVVAPKFINSEADIVLATLLFAAFCVWWRGILNKKVTWLRWIAIGILLSLAGLTKGPQPVAYFSLGVGAYLLRKARDQIPGFVLANALSGLVIGGWYLLVYEQPNDVAYWALHSRLLTTTGFELVLGHLDFIKNLTVETLPAAILLPPTIVLVLRQRREVGHDLTLAALLYASVCTLVLLVWPGGVAARYAMPATMALAVICGLMFEHFRKTQPRLIVSALVVTYLIFGGLLVRGWVAMPLWPQLFKESEIAGNTINSALGHIEQNPGPVYVIGYTIEPNMLVYVRRVIRAVTLDYLAELKTSAVAVLLPQEELTLARLNPGVAIVDLATVVSNRTEYRLVGIKHTEAGLASLFSHKQD